MTAGEIIALGVFGFSLLANVGMFAYGYGQLKESIIAIKLTLDRIYESNESQANKISDIERRLTSLEVRCRERHNREVVNNG